jgi:hypothetical protein
MMAATDNKVQRVELAAILRSHAADYLDKNNLSFEQEKAFTSIMKCRTSELGGHIDGCNNCGHTRQAYNSCRNRHCPKCQFIKQAQWVDKLASRLLPIRHFHVVFTIPGVLHKLFYLNKEKAYNLLLKAAGETIMQCAANPRNLGAQTGAVALLHTWGQTLVYHPHVHMIVPAGGLSEDRVEWVHSGKNFFVPVKILSAVFRGILCRLLEEAIDAGTLKLPDGCIDFMAIKKQCYIKKWVVYCQKPFREHSRLIKYLGNYSHRVAISNNRLAAHEKGNVSFFYKDYKAAGIQKRITLDASEFIRRFLQHTLPDRFYKIRYFGIMAMCNVKAKLEECFELIKDSAYLPLFEGLGAKEVFQYITGINPGICSQCSSGRMQQIAVLSTPVTSQPRPG